MATTQNIIRPKRVGRPSERKDEVVGYLRESILSGKLLPGGRMPTREQIIRQFNASPVTVNNALTELREGGFVEVRGNQGTFVAESLPHQTRYAVAFGQPKGDNAGSGYTASLAKECARVRQTQIDERELEIVPFYDLDRMWDSPDYVRLMEDVRTHRIAGIIAANNMGAVLNADDVRTSKIPLIANSGAADLKTCSSITFDGTQAAKDSLAYLKSKGARRPAFIVSGKDNWVYTKAWESAAIENGMIVEPYWIQAAHLAAPDMARRIAHLMMQLQGDRRPDSIVITDDNLVPYASQGIVDAGIVASDNIPIVAHANFPWPTPCCLPALRVGYDLREMIRVCIEVIDRMRANRGAIERQMVAPVSLWDDGQA